MKKPKQPKPPRRPMQPTKTIEVYGGYIDILDKDGRTSLSQLIDAIPEGIAQSNVYIDIDHDHEFDSTDIKVVYYKTVENVHYDKQMKAYNADMAKYNASHNKYLEAKKLYDEENEAYLKWAKDDEKLREGKMKDERIKQLEKELVKLKGKA